MSLEDTTGIVKFGAEWCGPCQQMEPIVEELEDKYNVIRVDIEEDSEIANEYYVRSLPTFLALEDGQVIDQHTGMATKEQLESLAP